MMSALVAGVGWVQGLPVAAMVGFCVAAAVVSGGLLIRAARTGPAACRRGWLGVAAGCVLWNAGHIGVLLGMPVVVNFAVFRDAALVTLAIGIGSFPGVMRPWWDWLVALADGWMSVGGVVVVAWLVLRDPDLDLRRIYGTSVQVDPFVLCWVAVDFAVMSVLAGLLARAPAQDRRAVSYVLVAGLLPAVGDMAFGLTSQPRPAMLVWALATVLIGLTQLVGGRNIFLSTFTTDEGAGARVIRLSQLPVLPALFFLFVPIQHDVVSQVLAAGVVAACFGNVAVHSQANARLLRTVSRQRGQFENLLTDSRDALIQTDGQGRIEYASAAAYAVLGRRIGDLVGMPSSDLVHPDDYPRVVAEVLALGASGPEAIRSEYRMSYGGDGAFRHFESTISLRQDAPGWVLSTRDVTTRVELREELAHQAQTDPLTGLLNRSAFLAAVGRAGAAAGSGSGGGSGNAAGLVTVLFIDLDGFKAVNDSLGHADGDRLLQQVADRIRRVTGDQDGEDANPAARLGGDEFAVLAGSDADELAGQLLEVIAALDTPGHPGLHQSASIGIAAAEGLSAQELLRDADLAMYRAKAAGGAQMIRFEPWMRERVLARTRLRERLESAILTDGLSLALQPVIDLATGRWHGFEALVRWQDGDVRRQPDEFIPLAEESGLIIGLGAWVMRRAVSELTGSFGTGSLMAVNVSPRQMEQDGFARGVLDLLEQTGLDPRRLILEITEQAAVQDLGRTASRLEPLRAEGIHVAIDDFGTGFSSMRYLTKLPVDALKIDRQFVDGLGVRRDDEVLVNSMLRLAADLGLDVVAEGVETRLQADMLREAGCHLAQGFFYSRPQPVEEIRRLWPAERDGAGDGAVPAQRLAGVTATSFAGSTTADPASSR